MTDKEKVQAAIERIEKEGIFDKRVSAGEIYEEMKKFKLGEIAKEITYFVNLIYDIRDILEGRNILEGE